ncbi:MAG: DNA translocase FtsK [Waddliaceae bacterium]
MSRKKKKNKNKKIIKAAPQSEHQPQKTGLLLLFLSIVGFATVYNFAYGQEMKSWLGIIGYSIGWTQLAFLGIGSYIFLLFIAWWGWRLLWKKPINNPWNKIALIGTLILSLGILLSWSEDFAPDTATAINDLFYSKLWQRRLHFHLGGAFFYYLYRDLPNANFLSILGKWGVFSFFSITIFYCILNILKISPLAFAIRLYHYLREKWHLAKEEVNDQRWVKVSIPKDEYGSNDMMEIQPRKAFNDRPSISGHTQIDLEKELTKEYEKEDVRDTKMQVNEIAPAPKLKPRKQVMYSKQIETGNFTGFKLPSLSLLSTPPKVDQSSLRKDLKRQAEVLEETLVSFGIEAKVGQINCGPTITSFEVHPAIGVKVQKIKALQNDIALNMEAESIRIIAPIPGKAAIGIEVPNPNPQTVSFKEILSAYQKSGTKLKIPILLGKTVSGEYVMSDLAKMPHCIIAGATGSGKSVCINTIVMSILMNAKPDEIKLMMVDPKKVELTPYTRLPHMLSPVITEPHGACTAMQWLVKEMEKRYEILKLVGVRNIDGFNQRKVNQEFEETLGPEIPEKMPYIVAIVDELADLMMVSSNEMETYIARIAQMARAVGIHLILATQRPSREVITGLIKANFPTRIAFKVASRINSQIILDEVGAETLLGNGDMLFLPPGTSHLTRAQGVFVKDQDINSVIDTICSQAPTDYVIKSFDDPDMFSDLSAPNPSDVDALYEKAYDTVVSTNNASTTFLQRKLKIGYARAASLIDQLEQHGIVGPANGSKARKILVKQDSEMDD